MRSLSISFLILLLCLANETLAQPEVGELPIEQLLQEEGTRNDASAGGGFELVGRILLTTVAAVVVLVGALVLYRRRFSLQKLNGDAEWVQVMQRVSLTPRHSVHLIRMGERWMAVGISGDRMTSLANWSEESTLSENDASIAPQREEASGLAPLVNRENDDEPGVLDPNAGSESSDLQSLLKNWRDAVTSTTGRSLPPGRDR